MFTYTWICAIYKTYVRYALLAHVIYDVLLQEGLITKRTACLIYIYFLGLIATVNT